MARRLRDVGFSVSVWNRTAAAAEPLAEAGCVVAESVAAAVAASEVVVVVLSDADAISDALLSANVAALLAGKTVVQMGTIGARSKAWVEEGSE